MFSFYARNPNEGRAFHHEETVAPDAYAHPVAVRAAEERANARRNREWRARAKDRAVLNAVIVDALVSAQKHDWASAKAQGADRIQAPPVRLGTITQLAFKALRERGWTKDKANDYLSTRMMPSRAPLEPLAP